MASACLSATLSSTSINVSLPVPRFGGPISSPVAARRRYPRSHFWGAPASTGKIISASVRRQRVALVSASLGTKEASTGGFATQFADFFQNIFKGMNRGQASPGPAKDGQQEGSGKRYLVAGATGRMGKFIVQKLLKKGHTVVALVSSPERAEKVLFEEQGLKAGRLPNGAALETAVGDVLDQASLQAAVDGCDAVICAVGARYSPQNGYQPSSSPEEVTGKGIPTLVRAFQEHLSSSQRAARREEVSIFDFTGSTESHDGDARPSTNGSAAGGEEAKRKAVPTVVDSWFVLDDVIMGGISDGGLQKGQGCVIFEGVLRSEGGGFSSIRAAVQNGPLDLSGCDGITLRVKGDGQRYKFGVRTQADFKGNPYVAMFDTVKDEWVNVNIPFDQFRAVERSTTVPDAAPLPTDSIHSVQILATLFQFDKQLNPLATPGRFHLEVASIGAYKAARPQFVLVSSAAVERSARAVSPEEREASIPIVKLNPGGVLTYKLQAEDLLRASGISYAIVRPCGLTDKDADQPFLLEVAQGDAITGLISREEVAAVCVEALDAPEAVNTTFEVRRDELSKGLPMTGYPNLFRRLRPDLRPGFVTIPPPLPDPAAPKAPALSQAASSN